MEKRETNTNGISSFVIRIIAVASMIWSFLAGSSIELLHNSALEDCMYWFSYTLFAFLLSEGVYNTSNRPLYLRRFLLFTVLSEVAYDYYHYGTYWSTKGQSVMLTLFICLIIMLICDYLNRKFYNMIINIVAVVGLSLGAIKAATFLRSEFAYYGILLAMLFYATRNMSYPKLAQIALLGYYTYTVSTDTIITITINGLQYSVPITVFAILALFVTWLYNEQRGPNKLGLKILFYLIYPVLLMIFFLLKNFLII